MNNPGIRRMGVALALLVLVVPLGRPIPLEGQWVEDPIIPRGDIFVRVGGEALVVDELYDAGRTPLGAAFRRSQVGVEEAVQLEPLQSRLQSLAGNGEAPALNLGATRARFSRDEQVVPLGLSYGLFDRVTLGTTVPIIRRRISGVLRVSPNGANVGTTPAQTEVSAFLTGAGNALAQAETAVEATCMAQGEADPECVEGRTFLDEADAFLADVGLAYADELIFPLMGSELGGLVADRWNGFLAGFSEWGAQAPSTLPLAEEPLGDEAFRSLVVEPVWPQSGFPLETLPSLLELGDIELHLALGLLQPEASGSDEGLQLRSAVMGTLRLPTGQPDSLRHFAPTSQPRGAGGVEVRWVSDLLLANRFAVLGVIEAGWHAARDMTLLVPDPARPFSPEHSRADVSWRPGMHVRARVTPRIRLASAMSIGVGWSVLHREADVFEPRGEAGPDLPDPQRGHTLHNVSLELRYTARHGPMAEASPLPFELFIRATRGVAGSGSLAPVERRIEAGVYLRVRD